MLPSTSSSTDVSRAVFEGANEIVFTEPSVVLPSTPRGGAGERYKPSRTSDDSADAHVLPLLPAHSKIDTIQGLVEQSTAVAQPSTPLTRRRSFAHPIDSLKSLQHRNEVLNPRMATRAGGHKRMSRSQAFGVNPFASAAAAAAGVLVRVASLTLLTL